MSNARETPSQRRAKEILEFVEAGQWKRGLQLCEKYQKKGDTSDTLKILKARCLLELPSPLNDRGIREAVELCDRNPPITDFDDLLALETCLRNVGRVDKVGPLWDKAFKARPQDRTFQEDRFWEMLNGFRWLDAQKAVNALQKNFPGDRRYYFWTILMSLFVYEDEWEYSKDERQLHGRLALGFIKRSATLVPRPDSQEPFPSRAIQTGEEIILLHHIFAAMNQKGELAQLVLHERPYLPIVPYGEDHSEDPVRQCWFLDLSSEAKQWDNIIQTCSRWLLPSSKDDKLIANRRCDNVKVWDALVDATIALNDDGVLKATEDKIQTFLDLVPGSSNAQMARLRLLDHRRRLHGSDDVRDELDDACEDIFRQECRAIQCLDKLRPFVNSLPPVRQEYFLHSAEMYAKSLPELELGADPKSTVLKFRYCFHISTLEGETAVKEIETFAAECVMKYRTGGTIPDSTMKKEHDVALVAVMTLVKLSEIGMVSDGEPYGRKVYRRGLHLIQALCLLECMLDTWPTNVQACLVALRLQLLLGLGSKAIRVFKNLNIKNVQHESFSHNYFTRLSTIHPKVVYDSYKASSHAFDDPLPDLDAVVRFYKTARPATHNAIHKGLTEGNYMNVMKTVEDLTSLENSVCRSIYLYEFRRGLRLFGSGGFDNFVLPGPVEDVLDADKRSFEAFPNWEKPGKPSFEEHLRLGPMPKGKWVSVEAAYDKIWAMLSGSLTGSDVVFRPPLVARHYWQIMEDYEEGISHELTPAEGSVFGVRIAIGQATAILLYPGFRLDDTPSLENYEAQMQMIGQWLDLTNHQFGTGYRILTDAGTLNGRLFCPEWTFLHRCFVTLETLQMLALFFKQFPALKKAAPAAVRQVPNPDPRWKGIVTDIADNIRDNARLLKKNLAEPGVLGDLIDVVLERGEDGECSTMGKELEQLLDEAQLERFCGSLRDSWDEALDGILAVKVKVA